MTPRSLLGYDRDSNEKEQSVKEKSPSEKGDSGFAETTRRVVESIRELVKTTSRPSALVLLVLRRTSKLVAFASQPTTCLAARVTVWLPSAFEFLGFCVPARTSIGHLVEGTERNLSLHRLPLLESALSIPGAPRRRHGLG